MTPLKENQHYEVELLPMGLSIDGDQTTDEEVWVSGQKYWNIFLTFREDDEIEEILDLDFPVEMRQLAEVVFDVVERTIQLCHRQRIRIY